MAQEGACDEPPSAGRCGGIAGTTCADGQFCNYEREDMCGAADQLGTCTDIPEACAEIFRPVCGCDGETYGNVCEANSRGVAVFQSGACGESS